MSLAEKPVLAAAQACAKTFAEALHSQPEGSVELIELGSQLDRLKIWAGEMGVFAADMASADHRLRNDQHTSYAFVMVLNRIKRILTQVVSVPQSLKQVPEATTAKAASDASSDSISDSSSDSDGPDLQEGNAEGVTKLDAISSAITDLYRLSAVVKKRYPLSEASRIEKFSQTHLDGAEIEDLEYYARWKLSQLFPEATSSEYLFDRLASAVGFRRKAILYRQRHAEKLRSGVTEAFTPIKEPLTISPEIVLSTDLLDDKESVKHQSPPPLVSTGKVAFSATAASSINHLKAPVYPKSVALSRVPSRAVNRAKDLDIPPCPKVGAGDAEVLCYYCSRIIKKKQTLEPYWTQHVLKDLAPYVCIFEDCDTPTAQFQDPSLWIQHMRKHNLRWTCKAAIHGPLTFSNSQDFQDHMRRQHSGAINEPQLATLVEKYSQPGPSPFAEALIFPSGDKDKEAGACPLCPFSRAEAEQDCHDTDPALISEHVERTVQDHVARHLDQIALWALPENSGQSDVEDVSQEPEKNSYHEDPTLPVLDVLADDEHGGIFRRADPQNVDVENFKEEIACHAANVDWSEILIQSGSIRGTKYAGHDADAVLAPFRERAETVTDDSGSASRHQSQEISTSPLYEAVWNNNLSLIKQLLDERHPIDCPDWDHYTPLHVAALLSHVDAVKLLIEAGANVDCEDRHGDTPLHILASLSTQPGRFDEMAYLRRSKRRSADILEIRAEKDISYDPLLSQQAPLIKLLIDSGASINSTNKKGKTPLHVAVEDGQIRIVEYLLELGASANILAEGSSPLMTAARNGNHHILTTLLDAGAYGNTTHEYYGSAIQAAVTSGNLRTVELLVEYKADINAQGGEYGSAIQAAAGVGNLEIFKLLIQHGADPSVHGSHYGGVLQIASAAGHSETVLFILNLEPPFWHDQLSASLQAACLRGDENVATILLDRGADVSGDSALHVGRTPLQIAAGEGSLEIVKLLLSRGAEVNANQGAALIAASAGGHIKIVRRLLEHGAEVNLRGRGEFVTALQAASKRGHLDVAQVLRDYGAKPYARRDEFKIGWVCALPLEQKVCSAALDRYIFDVPTDPVVDERAIYTCGEMGKHKVVIATPSWSVGNSVGVMGAAKVAESLRESFPSIRLCFLIGIGHGVPDSKRDIRLGDVVVSDDRWIGGFIDLESRASIAPPRLLLETILDIETALIPQKIEYWMLMMSLVCPISIERPGAGHDELFDEECGHVNEVTNDGVWCEHCERRIKPLLREPRLDIIMGPRPNIHKGLIASRRLAITSAKERRNLIARVGDILCFDTEAVGLPDKFPGVVIRGIHDYADSHLRSGWQNYAAAAAAAFARQLLDQILPEELDGMRLLYEKRRSSEKSSKQMEGLIEARSPPVAPGVFAPRGQDDDPRLARTTTSPRTGADPVPGPREGSRSRQYGDDEPRRRRL